MISRLYRPSTFDRLNRSNSKAYQKTPSPVDSEAALDLIVGRFESNSTLDGGRSDADTFALHS